MKAEIQKQTELANRCRMLNDVWPVHKFWTYGSSAKCRSSHQRTGSLAIASGKDIYIYIFDI